MFSSLTILIIFFSSSTVWSLEEPHQEIYLQPRNFNPHPYQLGSRTPPSPRGPIQFPPSPPPETEGSNFIRVDNSRKPSHPVDSHPYPKLVRKLKYRNPGRHQDFDNQINPQISRALAGHAKKVLGQSSFDGTDIEQKNYAFSYKVVDHLTGDDFSHTQSQNEKATSGEYRVKLPDGRVQIVSYTADKNGYKADVKYQEVADADSQQRGFLRQRVDVRDKVGSFGSTDLNSDVGKYAIDHGGAGVGVKATAAVPIHENRIEDYDYRHRDGRVAYATLPTPATQLVYGVTQQAYQNYQPTPSTRDDRFYPSLDYDDALRTNHHQQVHPHRFQIIPHNKVQIVNQGAPALSSTVAPYLEHPGIILSTPAPQFSGDYPHVFVKSLNGVYGKK